MKKLIPILIITFFFSAEANAQSAVTFSFDGQLTDILSGDAPVLSSNVSLRLRILNPAKDCLLYEETQNVDTTTTSGKFSVAVGSNYPSGKRTGNDPGLTMKAIFANPKTNLRNVGSANCAPGYSSAVTDARVLEVYVTVDSGAEDQLTTQDILAAPFAQTLAGKTADEFVNVDTTSNITQTNMQNVFNGYTALMQLINGTSTQYVTKSANGTASLPSYTATGPTTPMEGQIWYNSDTDSIMFYNGTTSQTLGGGGGGASGPAGGDLMGNYPNPTLANIHAGLAAGAASSIPVISVDAKGRVTSLSQVAIDSNPTGATLASGKIWIGNSGGVAAAVNISGDIALSNAGTATVNQLHGIDLDITATPIDRQVIRYNAGLTQFENTYLRMLDVISQITMTSVISNADCASGQALEWNSAMDTFSCQNIEIGAASVTGLGNSATQNVGTTAGTVAAGDDIRILASFQNGGNTNFGASATLGLANPGDLYVATSGTPRITVLGSGNVGVGTMTPTHKLTVAGNLKASNFVVPGDGSGFMQESGATSAMGITSTGGQGINLFPASGRIGINTAAPNAGLHINSGVDQTQLIVQGHPTQLASLQEWQNGSGAMMTRITNNGSIEFNSGLANIMNLSGDLHVYARPGSTTVIGDAAPTSRTNILAGDGGLEILTSPNSFLQMDIGSTGFGGIEILTGMGGYMLMANGEMDLETANNQPARFTSATGVTTIGSTAAPAQTVITAGTTGKIRIGAANAGAPFQSMGGCNIASAPTITNAAWSVAITCAGVPASPNVAVNCSHQTASVGSALHCRSMGTGNQIQCTSTATLSSANMTCMWLMP